MPLGFERVFLRHVPEGRPRIAQRFIAGTVSNDRESPEGTKETPLLVYPELFSSALRAVGKILLKTIRLKPLRFDGLEYLYNLK